MSCKRRSDTFYYRSGSSLQLGPLGALHELTL